MSVYMTEEEQLEAIKQWWKKYKNVITVSLSIILLFIAGFKYWSWHQNKINTQASNAYEQMMLAFSHQEDSKAQSYANVLVSDYASTVYSDVARLSLAKVLVEKRQYTEAKLQLTKAMQHSKMPALQQVARLRLARVLLFEQEYNQALKALEKVNLASYQPLVNELRGDIYAASGRFPQALVAYNKAIDESQSQGVSNSFLEMKTKELAAMTHSQRSTNKNTELT